MSALVRDLESSRFPFCPSHEVMIYDPRTSSIIRCTTFTAKFLIAVVFVVTEFTCISRVSLINQWHVFNFKVYFFTYQHEWVLHITFLGSKILIYLDPS